MSSIHQHFLHSTSNIDSTFKGTGLHFKTSQKRNSSNLTLQKDFGRKETMNIQDSFYMETSNYVEIKSK